MKLLVKNGTEQTEAPNPGVAQDAQADKLYIDADSEKYAALMANLERVLQSGPGTLAPLDVDGLEDSQARLVEALRQGRSFDQHLRAEATRKPGARS